MDVVSKEIDLPNLVKSRLADGATTSVSVNSNISNSCEPIPESWEDIVSDLGLSISPSTVDPPSVSSMPSGTTKVVTFAFSFLVLLFLLGLSGAHCFRLSQQRVQWVIRTPELGLLQLTHFPFSLLDLTATSAFSSFSSSLSAQYTLSTTLVTSSLAR